MADGPDRLERYYSNELEYLRREGEKFRRAHPKIANRLEVGSGESPDPHVERLLESFAFLTARVHARLDALFPEVSSSLLNVLCPHLISPVPSMAIVRFEPNTDSIPQEGFVIPRGTSLFARSSGGPDGPEYRFRTGYDTRLWPIEVTGASIIPHSEFTGPLAFLKLKEDAGVGRDKNSIYDTTALKLELKGAGQRALADLHIRSVRFYLSGRRSTVRRIHDFLGRSKTIVLRSGQHAPKYYTDRRRSWPISFPGFTPEEAMLPTPNAALSGFRLLQEYFAFPEKFFFFDLDLSGWRDPSEPAKEETIEIYFILRGSPQNDLPVTESNFQVNCAPVVNLFDKLSEPIRIDNTQLEYRICPDLRRERTTEIYSIDRVVGADDIEGRPAEYRPFFSLNHEMVHPSGGGPDSAVFWEGTRRPTMLADVGGTDLYIKFLDPYYRPGEPPSTTVYAGIQCTNRGLANELPEGTVVRLEVPGAPVLPDLSTLVTRPTQQRSPPLDGEALWRLVSSLALNHLSLARQEDSIEEAQATKETLRELLRIYGTGEPDDERQILAIKEVRSRRISRRRGMGGRQGFVRGTKITITLHDAEREPLAPGEAAMLVSVLSQFFRLYSSVNSFTQVVLTDPDVEGKEREWPPMDGQRMVL